MKNKTIDVRARIKKVEHPLITAWAEKHAALEDEMRRAIEEMPDAELQALRHAASSLTMTNCWYAEYDVRPMVEELIDSESTSRRNKQRPQNEMPK